MKLCNDCHIAEAISTKRPYCRPCRNARERKAYNPAKDRIRHLKYWYNITEDQYKQLLKKQKGMCGICASTLKTTRLNVDHDHKTGEVRGLLCTRCNLSLGLIEDAEFLSKAQHYLKGAT